MRVAQVHVVVVGARHPHRGNVVQRVCRVAPIDDEVHQEAFRMRGAALTTPGGRRHKRVLPATEQNTIAASRQDQRPLQRCTESGVRLAQAAGYGGVVESIRQLRRRERGVLQRTDPLDLRTLVHRVVPCDAKHASQNVPRSVRMRLPTRMAVARGGRLRQQMPLDGCEDDELGDDQ